MLKRIFSPLAIPLISLHVSVAQSEPQYSQIAFNQLSINPAYAGSTDMISATGIYKNQWAGFGPGAPTSGGVHIHSPIRPFGLSSGVGLGIRQDRFAFNQDLDITFSYAARIPIQGIGTLALGVSGAFINHSMNATWNPAVSPGDALIPQAGEQSGMAFDLGFGVFFNSQEMYLGASAMRLLRAGSNTAAQPSSYPRHFYLTGGYNLAIGQSNWVFSPSAFLVTAPPLNLVGVTTTFIYNNRVWGGLQYRLGEAVAALLGFTLFDGVRIGYAFDLPLSEISRFSSGSHEIMVGYSFSLRRERPPQQYRSIRFL